VPRRTEFGTSYFRFRSDKALDWSKFCMFFFCHSWSSEDTCVWTCV